MKRATLRFRSDSGGEYLYDDITGSILPWDDTEDAILNRELGIPCSDLEDHLLQSTPDPEIAAKTKFIRRWRDHYHAFSRPTNTLLPVPDAADLENSVWDNCMVLLLIVTEACNLKCRYCVYASETYYHHRKPTTRMMDYDLAVRAVDWYVKGVTRALTVRVR